MGSSSSSHNLTHLLLVRCLFCWTILMAIHHQPVVASAAAFAPPSTYLHRGGHPTRVINVDRQRQNNILAVAPWMPGDPQARQEEDEEGRHANVNVMDVSASRRSIFRVAGTSALILVASGSWTPSIAIADSDGMSSHGNNMATTLDNTQAAVVAEDADPAILLRQLQEYDRQLDEIISFADQQQWSQILRLVATTGLLGRRLSRTLEQIIMSTPDEDNTTTNGSQLPNKVQAAANKLQTDVRGIAVAATNQNVETCQSLAQQAVRDLEAVVRVAFCQTSTMVCFDASSDANLQQQQQERQESMDSLTEKLLGIGS